MYHSLCFKVLVDNHDMLLETSKRPGVHDMNVHHLYKVLSRQIACMSVNNFIFGLSGHDEEFMNCHEHKVLKSSNWHR